MEEQKKNPAQGLTESEQVQVRRQKLADLQAAGHDPFTLTKFPQDAYSADLKEEFKDLPNETDSGKTVALAGRMMSKRVMGKASFAHLRDDKGDIQLYVRRDELGEEPYAAFKKLDVGDIIGVKGEVFRTKTGELSVRATELTLLAKSLRPLPEKFHGLTKTPFRKVWLQVVSETGRPESYRCTQNQQHHRTNLAGTPHGKETHHRRNRSRTTWSSNSYRMCVDGYGMYRLYGKDGCRTPTYQCGENENAGSYRYSRYFRKHDLERRNQRSDPRLVLPSCRHLLYYRLYRRPSSLS